MSHNFAARDHYPVERPDCVMDETPALLRDYPPKATVLLELSGAQVLALASGKLIAYEASGEMLLIGVAMPSAVNLIGLDALQAIPASAQRVLMDALGQAGEEALLGLIPDLADYPPQPSGSTYRRTGTLGRLWTSAKPTWASKPTGFIGTLGNATSYGPYVQGDEQSGSNDHWQTATDVLDGHTAEITGIFEDALERAAKQLEQG